MSSPVKPEVPPRTSSVPSSPQKGPSIPCRNSSLAVPIDEPKRKALWSDKYSTMSDQELCVELRNATCRFNSTAKKLKPSSSFDSSFWSKNADLLTQERDCVAMESHLAYLKHQESSQSLEAPDISMADWQQQTEEGELLFTKHQALEQKRRVAEQQAARLLKNPTAMNNFVRLFVTSRQGFNIETGVGKRPDRKQAQFRKAMLEAYYPDRPHRDARWDPILGIKVPKESIVAAHLYPWSQIDSMDAIFGEGAQKEIFSPLNGLFLHKHVEKAFDKGWIAVVPDVDLEAKDPASPLNDLHDRQQRLRAWEAQSVKDYKVVVLQQSHKHMHESLYLGPGHDIESFTLADLHERKLQFKTNFRPRARYLWWGFLHAILRFGWQHRSDPNNMIKREVNKRTRYWGTRGRYVKRGMLLGFVNEIGHDAKSILENSIDEGEDEDGPDPEAVAVMTDETLREVEKELEADSDEEEEDEEDEDEED